MAALAQILNASERLAELWEISGLQAGSIFGFGIC